MDPVIAVLFVIGLVLLLAGGEALVRGAAGIAVSFGISPILVGLTVVAFGTSSPELAVSIGGALSGEPDLVVGNVVGSNIYNVLLVLGVAAVIGGLVVGRQLVRRDVPLMVLAAGASFCSRWTGPSDALTASSSSPLLSPGSCGPSPPRGRTRTT